MRITARMIITTGSWGCMPAVSQSRQVAGQLGNLLEDRVVLGMPVVEDSLAVVGILAEEDTLVEGDTLVEQYTLVVLGMPEVAPEVAASLRLQVLADELFLGCDVCGGDRMDNSSSKQCRSLPSLISVHQLPQESQEVCQQFP